MTAPTAADAVTALHQGRAFVDLSSWWKLSVGGSEARRWLNDLVTAEVGGLEQGRSCRSLLLTPTGRIRADFTVAAVGPAFLLVQDPGQPTFVGDLLDPYVLSSDVTLEDRTSELALVAVPGGTRPPPHGAEAYQPSCLGAGTDLVGPDRGALRLAAEDLVEAGPDAVETWRIERGTPRFGVDLGTDSLPHEAALDPAIAYGKGCFLGQEAVAKVRNLGHPPALVLAVSGETAVDAGEAVMAGDREVGRVTSAVHRPGGGTAAIVRVRWAARDSQLRTAAGTRLAPPDTGSRS